MSFGMGQLSVFEFQQTVDSDIVTPEDQDRWWETFDRMMQSPVIALDTETTGLNPWKAKPRLFQVGVRMPDETIRVLVLDCFQYPNYQESRFFEGLKYFIESPERWVILQNALYDCLCYRVWYGWKSLLIFDTFVASNMLWAGLPVSHTLDAIHERCLFTKMPLPEGLTKKELQKADWGAPILSPEMVNYGALDVKVLFPIAKKLFNSLQSLGLLESFLDETYFTSTLVEMEFNGLPVNRDLLVCLLDQYLKTYEDLYTPINEIWMKHGSQKKVMGVNLVKRKDFRVSRDADIREFVEDVSGIQTKSVDKQFLLEHQAAYPIFKDISLVRTLKINIDKLMSIKKALRKHPTGQWVVSGAFKQFSKSSEDDDFGGLDGKDNPAGTGRTGSGSGKKGAYPAPNLQNIPTYGKLPDEIKALGLRSVREIFQVVDPLEEEDGPCCPWPKRGYFVIHDLAAAHARFAAALSGDKLMAEIYTKDLDAHSITVQKLIKFLENFTPEMSDFEPGDVKKAEKAVKQGTATAFQTLLARLRFVGKNFFYSRLNGGGADILHRTFQSQDININLEGCQQALEEYDNLYHGLSSYLKDLQEASQIPPMELDSDIQTLRPRSNRSKWFCHQGRWYYPVEAKVHGKVYGRVFRQIPVRRRKQGDDWVPFMAGPKPPDVYSATWLRLEASVMKKAANLVYWWCLENNIPYYVGCLTHDELDGWSLDRETALQAADFQIKAMDGCMEEIIKPLPAGELTTPEQAVVVSWNDK